MKPWHATYTFIVASLGTMTDTRIGQGTSHSLCVHGRQHCPSTVTG